MKTLIVYDPEYSSTEMVTRAICAALGGPPDVEVCNLTDARPEQLAGVQWLIIGSPVRGFEPSPLIKEFVDAIPKDGLRGIKIAVFDRRLPTNKVPGFLRLMPGMVSKQKALGFAEKHIFDWLTEKGGEVVTPTPADWFHAVGTEVRLEAGELERATQWAQKLH
jgi:flavodoxin